MFIIRIATFIIKMPSSTTTIFVSLNIRFVDSKDLERDLESTNLILRLTKIVVVLLGILIINVAILIINMLI